MKLHEPGAALGQAVQIGRQNLRIAIAPKVSKAKIISKNKYNIGFILYRAAVSSFPLCGSCVRECSNPYAGFGASKSANVKLRMLQPLWHFVKMDGHTSLNRMYRLIRLISRRGAQDNFSGCMMVI